MATKEIAEAVSCDTFIHPSKPAKNRLAGAMGDFPPAYPSTVKTPDSEAPGPCKSDLTSFKTVGTAIQTQTQFAKRDVYQNHPKAYIPQPLRVSEDQRNRIIDRYNNSGESVRKISREEGRARQTVTRIVRSADTGELDRQLEEMRKEFRSMAEPAFKSLERAIKKDWRVAARYLEDIGVVPNRRRR